LGFRALELNSVIFAKAVGDGLNSGPLNTKVRGYAKAQASLCLPSLEQHNALFDCYMNCFMLAALTSEMPDWLDKRLKGAKREDG
jgi:hypothetical protein